MELHDTMDAAVWAKEFKRICDEKGYYCDEDWMLGWFANAIMVGWDFHSRRYAADIPMVKRATGRTIPDLTDREHVCKWQQTVEPQDIQNEQTDGGQVTHPTELSRSDEVQNIGG